MPVREIIDLLSSSPLPQYSPAPSTMTKKNQDLLMSSPLPPSPSVMFSAFAERAAAAAAAKAKETQGSKVEGTAIWDTPEDTREVELPPQPGTKNKRASKTITHAGVKKPRAQKATVKSKAEKKTQLRNGQIKARVVKNPLELGMSSKYFPEKPQPMGREHPPEIPTISTISDPTLNKIPLAPKSPNQGPHLEPPLYVTRRQWTPVKNTGFLPDNSSPLVNGEPKVTKATFSKMIGAMRYSTESFENAQEVSVSMDNRASNGLIKKQAIEVRKLNRNLHSIKCRANDVIIQIIGLPNSAAVAMATTIEPPIPKPKTLKQKRKTITDQATASYRTATASPLLKYLSPQTSITEDTDSQKLLSRKPGSPAKKKRKSDPETVILLSPTSARERFDSQEFVFETCSQLERANEHETGQTHDSQSIIGLDGANDDYYDEPPPPPSTSVARRGFLKTLARDRKGGSLFRGYSREMRYDRVDMGHEVPAVDAQEQPARQREIRLSKLQGTGGRLWNAAARDLDGGLLDVEFVDMTGSDNGDNGGNGCLGSESSQWKEDRDLLRDRMTAVETIAIGESVTRNGAEESWQSIRRETQIVEGIAAARENDPVQTIRGPRNGPQTISLGPMSTTALLVTPHTINPVMTRAPGDSSRSISSSATTSLMAPAKNQPNMSSPVLNPAAPKAKKSKQPKPAPAMPDFQSYHTTKLKAEIAKFGFKDMRTRDRMVSCLERCWDAQNKVATTAVQSAALPEANDSGPVANTTRLPQQDTNAEETVPALHPQNELVSALKKPRTRAIKKTEKEKATPKSPKPLKPKAVPKKKTSKAAPQSDDASDGAPDIIDLSELGSPKRKRTLKSGTRKPSIPPPSPKSAARKSTQLHHRISEMVRGSGRTGSKFSFYHSILMYDPIILEDMTSWLNSMPHLGKVDVEDVKAWCEANGVCCVKSESLRGKRNKR